MFDTRTSRTKNLLHTQAVHHQVHTHCQIIIRACTTVNYIPINNNVRFPFYVPSTTECRRHTCETQKVVAKKQKTSSSLSLPLPPLPRLPLLSPSCSELNIMCCMYDCICLLMCYDNVTLRSIYVISLRLISLRLISLRLISLR